MKTVIESVEGRRCITEINGVRGWKLCNGEPALVSDLGRLIFHVLNVGQCVCELEVTACATVPSGTYTVIYFKSDGQKETVSLKSATGRIDSVPLDNLRGATYRVVGQVQ